MQRRILSSGWTSSYKFGGPVAFVVGAAWVFWMFYSGRWPMPQGASIVILGGLFAVSAAIAVWSGRGVMWVEMDERNFYVSNYRREIVIPRSDLIKAVETRWKPFWITLHLSRPSEFGSQIVFIPPIPFDPYPDPKPLVEELNNQN